MSMSMLIDQKYRDDFNYFFVGADRLWNNLDAFINGSMTVTRDYPPHNIIKIDEDRYAIELAIAGFSENDIEVHLEDGKLTITGKIEKKNDQKVPDESKYVYRGIAGRSFTKTFKIADTIEVEEARLTNGMLKINLKHVIPDNRKAKKIEIKTGSNSSSKKEYLTE